MQVDVVDSGAFVKWQDTKPGEVYEDPKESSGLIALRLRSKQAVCLRKGSNVLLWDSWTPGPESLWVHKDKTVLTVA